VSEFEAVDGLTVEHVGKTVSVTCKPMAGYHRISAVGVLKGFTYMDGLTVYLEGVPNGVPFPMIAKEMTVLVEVDRKEVDSDELEKGLTFSDNAAVVGYWPGNSLNAPEVRIEIDAFHTSYDRDYGTTERITGAYDFNLEEAKKLHAFLGKVIAEAKVPEGIVPLKEKDSL
jgi:hypothetical protein